MAALLYHPFQKITHWRADTGHWMAEQTKKPARKFSHAGFLFYAIVMVASSSTSTFPCMALVIMHEVSAFSASLLASC